MLISKDDENVVHPEFLCYTTNDTVDTYVISVLIVAVVAIYDYGNARLQLLVSACEVLSSIFCCGKKAVMYW